MLLVVVRNFAFWVVWTAKQILKIYNMYFYFKLHFWGKNRLKTEFSNLNVLQKGKDWVFRLGCYLFNTL